jgi:hypothetical protein
MEEGKAPPGFKTDLCLLGPSNASITRSEEGVPEQRGWAPDDIVLFPFPTCVPVPPVHPQRICSNPQLEYACITARLRGLAGPLQGVWTIEAPPATWVTLVESVGGCTTAFHDGLFSYRRRLSGVASTVGTVLEVGSAKESPRHVNAWVPDTSRNPFSRSGCCAERHGMLSLPGRENWASFSACASSCLISPALGRTEAAALLLVLTTEENGCRDY